MSRTLSLTLSPISKSDYYPSSTKNPVEIDTLNILLIKEIYLFSTDNGHLERRRWRKTGTRRRVKSCKTARDSNEKADVVGATIRRKHLKMHMKVPQSNDNNSEMTSIDEEILSKI